MARYIDKADIVKLINDSFFDLGVSDDRTNMLTEVDELETVGIIRCKDCEHWERTWTNDFAPNYHYCPMVDGTRRNDFYCADAEEREDA